MPNPIGGRLQPSREAVEALLKSRKGKLVSTTPKESKVTLKQPRLYGNVQGVGKRAPMDHESSGFARYGNGSSKGKRLSDEFSKALNPSQAKRLATVKGKKDWGVENVRERQAIYSRIGIANRQNRVEANPKGNWEVSDGMPRAMRRRGLTYSDAERHMNKKPTTGDAGGVFKRIRNKDAESDRQRRLGMGVAAAGLGSALLLRRGLGGARQTTRALRGIEVTPSAWKRQSDRARSLVNHVDAKGKPVRGKGIAFTPGDLGATAGGTALGGSALGLEHYSRSRRNHRWE